MTEILTMRWSDDLKQGLHDICKSIENRGTMIEIGSYTGDSAFIFAQYFERVICVDPFIDGYDPNDKAAIQGNMNEVYRLFKTNTGHIKNIEHVRVKSDDYLPDTPVDFVYIDGIHTYHQVGKDIDRFLTHLKTGGYIGGHDYCPRDWPEVVRAVNERFSEVEVMVDTSWLCKKD